MTFDLYIGIDYSGRETPTSRTPALQVYAAFGHEEPSRILSPSVSDIPTIPGELFAKFQTSFYSDPSDAAFKALGVE